MKKIRKIIKLLIVCLLMVFLTNITVDAKENILEINRKGSISFSFEGKDSISDGSFAIYQVANMELEGADWKYDTSKTDFAESTVSLENIEDKTVAQELALFAEKQHIKGRIQKINESGEVCFDDLSVGLYLIVQKEEITGYYPMTPFLVSIPRLDEQSGLWQYDIQANMKAQLNPTPNETVELTVNKVWNDDGKNRPKFVEVQLLRNEVVYDEVTLSEANSWSYNWNDLSSSYSWDVKEVNIPDGYVADYQAKGNCITITNTSRLIQTGQRNYLIPIFAGAGVLLLLIGWLVIGSARDKRYAK